MKEDIRFPDIGSIAVCQHWCGCWVLCNQEQQVFCKLLSPLSRSISFFQISLIAFLFIEYVSVGTGGPQCMWRSEDTSQKYNPAQQDWQQAHLPSKSSLQVPVLFLQLVVVVMVCTCCTTVCTGVHACAPSMCWNQRSMLEISLYYSPAMCVCMYTSHWTWSSLTG